MSHVSLGPSQLTYFQNTGEVLWQDRSKTLHSPVTQAASGRGHLQTERPAEDAEARGKSQEPRAVPASQDGGAITGAALLPESIFHVWASFVQKSLPTS